MRSTLLFFVFALAGCNNSVEDKNEFYFDDTQVGEYISTSNKVEVLVEDDNTIVIQDLNFDYEELSQHFKFTKLESLDSIEITTQALGGYEGCKVIEFKFEGGFENLNYADNPYYEFTAYYTHLLGTFLWEGNEYYVFYRYVDACGYYNGYSLLPVNGGKQFVDFIGGMGDGGVYEESIITVEQEDDLIFDIEELDTEDEDTTIMNREKGSFKTVNGTLEKKYFWKSKSVLLYDEGDNLIDTLSNEVWFPKKDIEEQE